jgi:hypothetical protein
MRELSLPQCIAASGPRGIPQKEERPLTRKDAGTIHRSAKHRFGATASPVHDTCDGKVLPVSEAIPEPLPGGVWEHEVDLHNVGRSSDSSHRGSRRQGHKLLPVTRPELPNLIAGGPEWRIAAHPPRTDLGRTLGAAFRASQTPAQGHHGHIVHSPGYEPSQVNTGAVTTGPAAMNDPLRIEVGDIRREGHGAKRSAQ